MTLTETYVINFEFGCEVLGSYDEELEILEDFMGTVDPEIRTYHAEANDYCQTIPSPNISNPSPNTRVQFTYFSSIFRTTQSHKPTRPLICSFCHNKGHLVDQYWRKAGIVRPVNFVASMKAPVVTLSEFMSVSLVKCEVDKTTCSHAKTMFFSAINKAMFAEHPTEKYWDYQRSVTIVEVLHLV